MYYSETRVSSCQLDRTTADMLWSDGSRFLLSVKQKLSTLNHPGSYQRQVHITPAIQMSATENMAHHKEANLTEQQLEGFIQQQVYLAKPHLNIRFVTVRPTEMLECSRSYFFLVKMQKRKNITSITKQLKTPYLFTYHPIVPLPGARNHYYFVLFLLSLMLLGSWMLYACFMCEWFTKTNSESPEFFKTNTDSMFCFSRLVHSLHVSLWGSGSVGGRHSPGHLLPLGAQHLRAVVLSHLLVQCGPAGAALPGDGARVDWLLCLKNHL